MLKVTLLPDVLGRQPRMFLHVIHLWTVRNDRIRRRLWQKWVSLN